MNKKIQKSDSSFTFLKVFLIILVGLIILSLIVKAVRLHTNSTLHADSYTVLLIDEKVYLVNVDKENNTFFVSEQPKKAVLNSKLRNSMYYQVPMDGVVVVEKPKGESFLGDFMSFQNAFSTLLHGNNYYLDGINSLDVAKIYYAKRGVSENDYVVMTEEETSFPEFRNREIFNEKTSIEVVNASEINGLGNSVATMLRNGGYNVVSIISTDPTKDSKIISRVTEGKALEGLQNLFPIKVEYATTSAVADISVYVGKELGQKLTPQ